MATSSMSKSFDSLVSLRSKIKDTEKEMERTRQDILSRSEQYEVKVERLRSNQNNIMAQDVRIQELRAKYAQVTQKPLSQTQDAVDNSETSRRLQSLLHIAAEPMKRVMMMTVTGARV